jgi:hypothetical protein
MTDSREDQYDDTADTEIEIETVAEDDSSDDDQFQKAEDATQKRINRLTKKMREAERQRDESIRYAQQVQTEAQTLKSRLTNLDTSYVNEYSTRVSTQIAQAEAALSRAIEMGDSKGTVEAQRTLTQSGDPSRSCRSGAPAARPLYATAGRGSSSIRRSQPMPAQQPRRPDAKAEQWALRNSWFGQDEAMTYAAFGIHKKLIEDEGFDPQSDDYYNELDRRISSKFGGQSKSANRPAQTVAGASRAVSAGRNGRKVRLTPSQVAIAKKLGVPLEEYAKYVKE